MVLVKAQRNPSIPQRGATHLVEIAAFRYEYVSALQPISVHLRAQNS